MRILESAREIRYRRENDEERMMRIILEERSPLRVELEAAAAEGGMIYRVGHAVGLSVELTPESFDDRILFWTEHAHSREVLLEHGDGRSVALIRVERGSSGHLTIEVAAPELEIARELAQEFAARFGRKKEPEDGSRVCVSFWRDGAPQPDSTDRFLDTVRWDQISANYSAATSQNLTA